MKKFLILNFSFILCSFLVVGGCASMKEYATPANARTATALVCSNTITFAVDDADRVVTANYIYAVAHAVRTLSGGNVPTPAELKAAVIIFTPESGKWVTLGTNISSIYGALYPRIQGNSKIALEYLEAIAAGCEDAASSFLPMPGPLPLPGR